MSEWNAALYDNKHDFVAEYGKGLLEYIPQNEKQSILDLGCGTGTLTVQLNNLAKTVIGVDQSESMIKKAQEQYSNIEFRVCDALALPFESQFDVVFSNAVFHWIKDHEKGLENWMRQFFASELEEMSKDIQSKIIKEVEDLTKDKLWKENEWIADYRRLRVIAHI